MKSVQIRNITIGEGMPKICVPIVATTREEIYNEACMLKEMYVDVVEWRMDFFEHVNNGDCIKVVAKALRSALGDTPLLATFRSLKEGGQMALSDDEYTTLNKAAIDSGSIDLIDVELFSGDALVNELVSYAHENDVVVVMSNHDFDKTPSYDEIITRLKRMQDMNADIPKIAVMPTSKRDVLTLLQATNDMATHYATRPIITMSMASDGVISRLCGEVFGSALTFGAAKKASAPGQMAVKELKTVLEILHQSL